METRRRLTGLFVIFFVLFSYPCLRLFSSDALLLGIPSLYIGIFCLWLLLIALSAVILGKKA